MSSFVQDCFAINKALKNEMNEKRANTGKGISKMFDYFFIS